MLGAYSQNDRAKIAQTMEEVFDLFPVLKERMNQPGGTLSGGEQQMLAVGRALMAPRACCCWTSLRWAWRPWWSISCSIPSSASTRSAA